MTDSANDTTIALPRKLAAVEAQELRLCLMPILVSGSINNNHNNSNNKEDEDDENGNTDLVDFLEYTLAMISNGRSVGQIRTELEEMEMNFFSQAVADRFEQELASYISQLLGVSGSGAGDGGSGSDDKKATAEHSAKETPSKKENALTMSGALGASRDGSRNKSSAAKDSNSNRHKAKVEKKQSPRKNRSDGGGRNDRRGRRGEGERRSDDRERGGRGSGRGDRGGGRGRGRDDHRGGGGGRGGGRSTHREVFDRLSRGRGEHGGRDHRHDRGSSQDRDDGFGGGRRPDVAGRGRGRDGGGRGGRGGRTFERGGPGRGAGNRRSRDDYENGDVEFMSVQQGGARGRGGPDGRGRGREVNKRGRYDDPQYDEGYNGHFDDGSGYYNDGYRYDHSEYHHYPPHRGRGRGQFGRGGRGGRGHGNSNELPSNDGKAQECNANQEGNGYEQHSSDAPADGAVNHPSPMVQASFSGRGGGYSYSYTGRGRFGRGRGRGRGRFGGRAEVVNMIQSRTWVRKKDDSKEGGNTGDSPAQNNQG